MQRKFKPFNLILLFIIFGFQNVAFSQDENVIRIDTNLVTVPVRVLTATGDILPI